LAVTDPAIVASTATGVLFVIGAQMTSRQNAIAALDQLESVQAAFVGAVLNRVDLRRNGYYYSDYYHHKNAEYYRSAS
jgi:Mrp family chromosome partitioning ATPase